MYIAVRKYKTEPKLVDAALKEIGDAFMPVLKLQPGFVAYYAYREGEGGITSISVFQSPEAAEMSTKSAANLVKMSLAKLLPNAPDVFHGPVACHSLADAQPVRKD
ncbi:MAG: hypothetical protein HY553_18025 [Elusimicrobia bacterium]|nr:hypothetical protein [Elusimicrobiota bacterium]